jgi:two-component system, OmpR family, sensor histidine kinase KdpD
MPDDPVRSDPDAGVPVPQATRPARQRSLRPYALSLALVAIASLVSVPVHLVISPTNLVMFYLAAVMIAALYLGRGPAVLAAVAGIAAFDLFFVAPRFALSVADTEYLLTFVGLFVVGMVVSSLTAQLRDQVQSTRQRETEARTLYEFSRDLATAGNLDEILPVISHHVRHIFGRDAVVVLPRAGSSEAEPVAPTFAMGEDDRSAADWSLRRGEPAGRGTDVLPGIATRYLPLRTARGVLGVLAVRPSEPGAALSPERRRLLEVFASLAALAIERAQLAEEARQAQVLQATEKLQSALLDSISHDLRTPLVTITGALTALDDEARADVASTVQLNAAARRGLLTGAREETERLNRLVGNLLDIARLEAGAVRVAPVPSDVEALIGSALDRLGNRLADRPVTVDVADPIRFVPMDATLMVQVLVNLLDNAVKHGLSGTPIEVHVGSTPAGLAISVADRGPGVPEADLAHIFDKFHQVQRRGGPSGTGLGLAVCKGIVEAHGGRISARNRAEGGLEVTLLLPTGPEPANA